MKIELKNVKRFEAMSEETHCFTASVYIDGVKRGTAKNEGHGGPNWIEPFELQKEISEYVNKNVPPMKLEYGGKVHELPHNADSYIGQLMDDWCVAQDLKKVLKVRLVGITSTGTLMSTKKLKAEAVVFHCQHKTPLEGCDKVLNYLPFEEALEIYRRAA